MHGQDSGGGNSTGAAGTLSSVVPSKPDSDSDSGQLGEPQTTSSMLEQGENTTEGLYTSVTELGNTESDVSRTTVPAGHSDMSNITVPTVHSDMSGSPVQATVMAGPVQATMTAGPVQATVTAGPVQATVTAGPVQTTLTAGDDSKVSPSNDTSAEATTAAVTGTEEVNSQTSLSPPKTTVKQPSGRTGILNLYLCSRHTLSPAHKFMGEVWLSF